ncbi:MAG TPA: hypothetical protein VGF92_02205 [Stellaceae bacterium]|jgi:hypothetical protein
MPDDAGSLFPTIRNARGGPSADGCNLLVEGLTAEGSPVRFAVPLSEVHHLVSFLLVSVAKITESQSKQGMPELLSGTPPRPIPATAISVGEPENGEGYMVMSVGCADLVFSVPITAFEPVARVMLLASVQSKEKPV